jgi:hypothetical protein
MATTSRLPCGTSLRFHHLPASIDCNEIFEHVYFRTVSLGARRAEVCAPSGFQIFGGYGMGVAGAKGGEGMGRAAAAEVRGGWVGMVLRVQASPDHAPAARAPLLGRPAGAVAPAVERSGGFPRPLYKRQVFVASLG